MVIAQISLGETEARVVNIVKGKYGLRNKSEAIRQIIGEYHDNILEPEIRPEYRKELLRIDRGKFTRFKTIAQLRKEIEK